MEGRSTCPRPVDGSAGREMSTANTFARRESGVPVDNFVQRLQTSHASGRNVVVRDNPPVIIIPEGIAAREPRRNPESIGQQLPPPEVARQLQFFAQMPHDILEDQGRRPPPASEYHLRSPLPEAGQRQPASARELAAPRPPAGNHSRENQPLEAARNQQLIEIPQRRDSVQMSQRNIPVVGNDGLQGRQFPPARDFLQPRSPRAEINPNMAQVAQTFIPIIESILTLSQNIVWILSLFFFFMVLVLITSRIMRFFFPLDTMTDSPRLLFRLSSSGYSNATTIYEMVFPLSVSNPFLFIVIILGAIVVTRIIADCVKVCSNSPRC